MTPMLPEPLAEQQIALENARADARRLRTLLAQSPDRQDLERRLVALHRGLVDDLGQVSVDEHEALSQLRAGIEAVEQAIAGLHRFDDVLDALADGELLG